MKKIACLSSDAMSAGAVDFEIVKEKPRFESHWNNPRVEPSEWGFCDQPTLFSTDGLGPCIGICIAWKAWAAICHLGSLDEHDLLPALITKAKEIIPEVVVQGIRPVICGGDIFDERRHVSSRDREDYAKTILDSRNRVVEILKEAGFGKPRVRWNDEGETISLIADLRDGIVYIENNIGKMWRSPI